MQGAEGAGRLRLPLQVAEIHAGQVSRLFSRSPRRTDTSSVGLDTLSDFDTNQKREDVVTLSEIPMPKATWDWESRIGLRVKLRDLHILSAVVRWKGMARAAPHLAMSQAAVLEAIANLERALGVRLLDRSPQGVEPTIYANALLKRGRVVFDELRQGIKDIEFLANPKAGEVRVGCAEALAAGLVSVIIGRLYRRDLHVDPPRRHRAPQRRE